MGSQKNQDNLTGVSKEIITVEVQEATLIMKFKEAWTIEIFISSFKSVQ